MGVEVVRSCHICERYILPHQKYIRDEDGEIVHVKCLKLLEKYEEEHKEDMDLMGY